MARAHTYKNHTQALRNKNLHVTSSVPVGGLPGGASGHTVVVLAGVALVPEQGPELNRQHVHLQAVEEPPLRLVALPPALGPAAGHGLQGTELWPRTGRGQVERGTGESEREARRQKETERERGRERKRKREGSEDRQEEKKPKKNS